MAGSAQNGPGITYEVVARNDGSYYIRIVGPSEASVIVGVFPSGEEAQAWLEARSVPPKEPR
jgi:hypothetical protein